MPNIEPIIGAAVKGARKIAGIVGAGAKDVHPTYRPGGVSNISAHPQGVKVKASDNVNVIIKAKPNYEFNKDLSTIGKIQKQNAGPLGGKAEAKANARGLKAANKPIKKK